MGNCQAAEAAEVIIQHPGGKVERLYWPTPAAEVMKTNPGHYVALVILRLSPEDKAAAGDEAAAAAAVAGAGAAAKITRVKLLKPKDVLHLGQVYRLITAQEVTKALRARKNDKMRRCEAIKQQHDQLRRGDGAEQGASDKNDKMRRCEAIKQQHDQLRRGDGAEQGASDKDANANAKQRGEKDRHRGSGGAQPAGSGRGRHWRPSLQSISEAAAGQSSSASSSISESTAS
ncbi:unnamed protein product [Triticum turgidum subsp. durum]|uniref:Uncharacterized protein n=1 Tax=Triticum turgidum subsp. durum TaxID=4567 RepID=A0A9R0X8M0_TRITD|nr:unnamed protein product [Triticum turgidum subsp. durum]